MDRVIHMLDGKAAAGTLATISAATSGTWLDVAEPLVTITMTVIVGSATLWYTIERALKLRKERKDNESI